MSRIVAIVPLALLLLFGTPVCAQGTVPQYAVVENFAEALSAGRATAALAYVQRDAVWSEYDLSRQEASGLAEVVQRVRALIDAGVRLEVELAGVHAGGMVLVTHERMWADFVPEELAPLRSVAVYVVERGVLTSVSRVLAPEQRDAWAVQELTRDTWSIGRYWSMHFEADGRYRLTIRPLTASERHDSGTFTVSDGVLTFVSGEESNACDPGDAGSYHASVLHADRWLLQQIDEACLRRAYSGAVGVSIRTEVE